MQPLVRRLLVFAAVDGLVIQPAPPRNHPPNTQQAIKIEYKTHEIAPLLKDRREEDTASALEAHGIIGILRLASSSFLVSISGREQVAQIREKPVYVVTDVALIPLSSQGDADKAITQARQRLKQNFEVDDSDETDTETDALEDEELGQSVVEDEPEDSGAAGAAQHDDNQEPASSSASRRRTSIAENVIGKKGKYGRFAERWFSKRGWSAQGRRMQGMSSDDNLPESANTDDEKPPVPADLNEAPKAEEALPDPFIPSESDDDKTKELSPTQDEPKVLPTQGEESTVVLLPKIIRTTKLLFSSRNFFFSYDYDISHSVAKQPAQHASLPLYKAFDPLFFWNKYLATPLIDAEQHSFVLPLIQGFVGQRTFSLSVLNETSESIVIDATPTSQDAVEAQSDADTSEDKLDTDVSQSKRRDFLLTLISRRSVKRAGLRYLRRGIDEEGNVANYVESEQLLSSPTWDSSSNLYSFVQVRGSIPLFFSQSPYSLKPVPSFYGSFDTNLAAFRKHFAMLAARYGGVQVASLIDKHGTEAKIGEPFEKAASNLNASPAGIDGHGATLGFEWFDFHNVCRGMRFENVSQLMDILSASRAEQGWTVKSGDKVTQAQTGVLRTNCMDCLDRTNVVQAATARSALEAQLAAEHVRIDLQADPSTAWFNTLWADNGDAVSKQYAGTAALKGDYTRTRRRNVTGALTDFGLTLNRYYNNIVNDYFAQAVMDYLLGRARLSVFGEFEADMKAQDYAVDLRKVRQAAIETCAKIVVDDDDNSASSPTASTNESGGNNIVAGWTLSCPSRRNALRGTAPFEECVLLLSERAVYFCRFDWGTEKVREFERVALRQLREVQRGAYITSALSERHTDPDKNVGLVLRYEEERGGRKEVVRVNTRSLDSGKEGAETGQQKGGNKSGAGGKGDGDGERFLAFKALPPRSSYASFEGQDSTEPPSEVEMVRSICDEIQRMTMAARRNASDGGGEVEQLPVEERDIISLAEAKKSTGYLEQLGYSLKKLVWT